MDLFDITEIPFIKPLGVLTAVAGILFAGYVIYNKVKKVSFKVLSIEADDTKTTITLSAKNLLDEPTTAKYHFEYNGWTSDDYTIALGPKEVKVFTLTAFATMQDPSNIDKNKMKIFVDDVVA